jgi:hypothetical protein
MSQQQNQEQSQNDTITLGQTAQPSSTVAMAQQIGSGKMPENETIVSSLKDFEEPLSQKAQGTGQEARIAQHTQNFLQHTREMFQEKNADNTLQNIHSHSKDAATALAEGTKEGHQQTIGTEQGNWTDERVLELRNLLQAFRKTATALARNNSFRTDLIESVQLFQTLIFDFTQTTLDKKLTKAKSNIQDPSTCPTSTNSAVTNETCPSTTPTTGDAQPSTFTVPLTHVGGQEQTTQEIDRPRGTITPVEPTQSSSGPAMNDQERKYAFEKLRKIMLHLGQTPEYKDLIEQLTNFIQHNGKQMAHIATSGRDSSKSALRALGDDIQLVLEKFSGEVTLTPLRERINVIIRSIQSDPQVKTFFAEWRNILLETVRAPEQKDPAELDAKFQELSLQGKALLQKPNYRDDYNFCLTELRQFLGRVKEDTHLQQLGSDVEGLRREIMLNEKGQLDFGQVRKSLPALKNVLIPTLTSALKTIPVPPIKTDDEKFFLEVTNLSLSAQDLVPENLRLHFANDLYFDFSGSGNDRFDSALSLSMNEFHATLRDLSFRYERKKMPRMTDEGTADIEIAGMILKFRWLMEKDQEKLTFVCDKVRCQIRELNTNVKEAQHKILDKLALKLFNSQIKRGIEQSTEKALKEKLERFTIDTSSSIPLKDQIKMGGNKPATMGTQSEFPEAAPIQG